MPKIEVVGPWTEIKKQRAKAERDAEKESYRRIMEASKPPPVVPSSSGIEIVKAGSKVSKQKVSKEDPAKAPSKIEIVKAGSKQKASKEDPATPPSKIQIVKCQNITNVPVKKRSVDPFASTLEIVKAVKGRDRHPSQRMMEWLEASSKKLGQSKSVVDVKKRRPTTDTRKAPVKKPVAICKSFYAVTMDNDAPTAIETNFEIVKCKTLKRNKSRHA